MKERISDMLDGLTAEDVELTTLAPLSSRRIKEMTMKKANGINRPRRSGGFRVLVAAAVLASLAVTAFAAERIFGAGDWFRGVLNAQLEQDQELAREHGWDLEIRETLGQDQVDVINELGMTYENNTQTDQGTSITLNAAYAGEHVLHLYFQVEAPEGTVLPDGIIYQLWDICGEREYDFLTVGEKASYEARFRNVLVEPLADANPNDNRKDFHVTVTGDMDHALRFNDGVKKSVHIAGLYEQKVNVDGDQDATVPLVLCDVTFDVTLKNELKHIELDVSKLAYSGTYVRSYRHPEGVSCNQYCPPLEADGSHTERYGYSITPSKFVLSAMGVEWANEYKVENPQLSMGLAYTLVMKDGTSPVKARNYAGTRFGDTKAAGMDFFSAPIDLDNVDYIIIGNPEWGESHKVYLSE